MYCFQGFPDTKMIIWAIFPTKICPGKHFFICNMANIGRWLEILRLLPSLLPKQGKKIPNSIRFCTRNKKFISRKFTNFQIWVMQLIYRQKTSRINCDPLNCVMFNWYLFSHASKLFLKKYFPFYYVNGYFKNRVLLI